MTRKERVRQMAIPIATVKTGSNRPKWEINSSAFEEVNMAIDGRIRQNNEERVASYQAAYGKVII